MSFSRGRGRMSLDLIQRDYTALLIALMRRRPDCAAAP